MGGGEITIRPKLLATTREEVAGISDVMEHSSVSTTELIEEVISSMVHSWRGWREENR